MDLYNRKKYNGKKNSSAFPGCARKDLSKSKEVVLGEGRWEATDFSG